MESYTSKMNQWVKAGKAIWRKHSNSGKLSVASHINAICIFYLDTRSLAEEQRNLNSTTMMYVVILA